MGASPKTTARARSPHANGRFAGADRLNVGDGWKGDVSLIGSFSEPMKMFAAPNPLELRSASLVGRGYLAAALAGGLVGAAGLLALSVANDDPMDLPGFLVSVAFIGLACLVVELFLASPLLVMYRYFRWRYLNIWTAGLLGFAIGAAPALILLNLPSLDSTLVPSGYFYLGHLTAEGYWRLLRGVAWTSSIGLASAVTLALFAVRRRHSE